MEIVDLHQNSLKIANNYKSKEMKTVIAVCFFYVLCFSSQAQTEYRVYEKDFVSAVEQGISAGFRSDSISLVKAVQRFSQFTKDKGVAEKAYYYMAFCKWQSVLRQTSSTLTNNANVVLLESALEDLKNATALNNTSVETMALGVNIYYALYNADPQNLRAYIGETAKLRAQYQRIDPKNPLAVLTEAQHIYYSPKQFGGDQKKGIELYHESIDLFKEQQKNWKSNLPHWGLEIAYSWLANAYYRLEEQDLARARKYFKKSLEIRPDYAWVRDSMMPLFDN